MTRLFYLLACLAVIVGLYPLLYYFLDWRFGLVQTKTPSLLENLTWKYSFYMHLSTGGLALLIGWLQFVKRIRQKKPQIHRALGKSYVLLVLVSGLSALYLSLHATGGRIAGLGFACLAIIWIGTTVLAFLAIRKSDLTSHKNYMRYSYALCFAAVTLRLWLPLLSILFSDFNAAYRVVAWLCWIPNLLVAAFINGKLEKDPAEMLLDTNDPDQE